MPSHLKSTMPSSEERELEVTPAHRSLPMYISYGMCWSLADAVAAVPSFTVMSARMGLDYFGIFDGCFGSCFANHLLGRLHVAIAKEIESELHSKSPRYLYAGGNIEGWWRTVVQEAFRVVDDELVARVDGSGVAVGSPAVIALVMEEYLVFANRGATSMAVIYRDEEPVLLKSQRNPEPYKKKEKEDVQTKQGHMVKSTSNLEDNMTTSRAISLRSYFPEPEVLTMKREPRDKFLILATGAFWAYISPTEACNFIQKKLLMSPTEMLLANTLDDNGFACIIAKELVKQAILRGGRRNVTAGVILFKNF